jgi:hypothetical protein
MSDWCEIEARIKLECPTGVDQRPTEADLDRYEAEAGYKLPDDYRRFALAYGPGSLAGAYDFKFYTPGVPEAGLRGDLAAYNPPGDCPKRFRGRTDKDLAKTFGRDPAQLRRMVFFCSMDGYDSYAWDPAEVTDPLTNDKAIYRFVGERSWPVASRTFREFLEFIVDFNLHGKYWRNKHISYVNNIEMMKSCGKLLYFQFPGDRPGEDVQEMDD